MINTVVVKDSIRYRQQPNGWWFVEWQECHAEYANKPHRYVMQQHAIRITEVSRDEFRAKLYLRMED